MTWIEPVTLSGYGVRLEPLRPDHHDALVDAVRDGELWRLWFTVVPTPERMRAEVDERLARLASGTMLPFAVVDAPTGRVVGMTAFADPDPVHRRVEIGYTWYAASVQGTGVNTGCKLLMLSHAFEVLGCVAVELRTHRLNEASRRAIEGLGAQLDGILRNHRRQADGTLRDTCVYSVVEHEWPTVRRHLEFKASRPRRAPRQDAPGPR